MKFKPSERIRDLSVYQSRHSEKKKENLVVNLPKLVCPRCGSITAFKITSGHNTDSTPFEIKKKLDAETKVNEWETDYLDVHCRDCSHISRIVYEMEEFAMSCYRYYILEIIETEAEQTGAPNGLQP